MVKGITMDIQYQCICHADYIIYIVIQFKLAYPLRLLIIVFAKNNARLKRDINKKTSDQSNDDNYRENLT